MFTATCPVEATTPVSYRYDPLLQVAVTDDEADTPLVTTIEAWDKTSTGRPTVSGRESRNGRWTTAVTSSRDRVDPDRRVRPERGPCSPWTGWGCRCSAPISAGSRNASPWTPSWTTPTGSGSCAHRKRETRRVGVRSVWYRRPTGFTFPDALTGARRRHAEREARFGVGGVLSSLPVAWMHPQRDADAIYKPRQLALAARCGLDARMARIARAGYEAPRIDPRNRHRVRLTSAVRAAAPFIVADFLIPVISYLDDRTMRQYRTVVARTRLRQHRRVPPSAGWSTTMRPRCWPTTLPRSRAVTRDGSRT